MSAFTRSYARALVESAPKGTDVEKLLEAAGAVARALASDGRLKEFFAAPGIPRDAKRKALEQLAERAGVEEFGRRFLGVVLANGRILHLAEILSAARDELDRTGGIAQAHVTVAAPVGPEEERRIEAALARSLGGRIRLAVAVDPAILGGFVARVGSRVIDASVASAIGRFQERSRT